LALTGCEGVIIVPPNGEDGEPDDTGTVNIELSGDWEYDLKMDGDTYFTDVDEGTYTINDVPVGDHTFEAIDTDGESYGYASETQYISTGTNTVYLEPEPETGTVQIEVDDNYEYEVYMDGDYLGTTDEYGEGTFEDIPTGYHSFYVISTDNAYEGSESVTIDTGNNLVEIDIYYIY
jgi:hypothetical protein